MSLPANWKLVEVHGTYLRNDGLPNVGSVWFESRTSVYVDTGDDAKILVVPRRLEAQLDDTGSFSILLPTTDDASISPVGWTYAVKEKMAGGREFAMQVPVAMDAINLITWSQALPQPLVPTVYSYLTTADIGVNVASKASQDQAIDQSTLALADAVSAVTSSDSAVATANDAATVANGIASIAQSAFDASAAAVDTAGLANTNATNALAVAAAQAANVATNSAALAALAPVANSGAYSDLTGQPVIIPEAPVDGEFYVRGNNSWVDAASLGATVTWDTLPGKPTVFPTDWSIIDAKPAAYPAATKLATARTIALTGVITAAGVAFDGTAAIALATAVADNALTIGKTSGLQAALDAKQATLAYTPADDALVVKLAGAQIISGAKTFTSAQRFMGTGAVGGVTVGGYTTGSPSHRITLADEANAASTLLLDTFAEQGRFMVSYRNNGSAGLFVDNNPASGSYGVNVSNSFGINFGVVARQMLNLYDRTYALGVQSNTLYNRSNGGHAWFSGGVHSGTQNDPGAGGTLLMQLDSTGNLTLTGNVTAALASAPTFASPTSNVVVATTGAGGLYLRANGAASTSGQVVVDFSGRMTVNGGLSVNTVSSNTTGLWLTDTSSPNFRMTGSAGSKFIRVATGSPNLEFVNNAYSAVISSLTDAGVWTAADFVASSDIRHKRKLQRLMPRRHLADALALFSYDMGERTGVFGHVAQHVRDVAPQYVSTDVHGYLGIDKAGLALEAIMGLAQRVRELEAANENALQGEAA